MSLYSSQTLLPPQQAASWLSQMLHTLKRVIYISLCGFTLMLAGCSSVEAPTPVNDEIAAPSEAVVETAAQEVSADDVTEIEPYSADQTTGPIRVQIPAIGLDAPIIAMGWRVEIVDGARTTVWDVPMEEAGWHINSMGAGGLGNTVVSGRQVEGAAVFAPLALGSVAPGQDVLLTDGDGIVFVYRISEVTDPIPVTGATPDEVARATTYFAPTTTARLTLVTGWPDFTTTHRIFAVADFIGVIR